MCNAVETPLIILIATEWMDDSEGNIEIVVIFTHANNGWFVTDTEINESGKRVTSESMHREDIINLAPKNIDAMYLLGCNMGMSLIQDNDQNCGEKKYDNKYSKKKNF